MNLTRILRHLSTGQLAVRRKFPAASLAAIEHAIQQSEMQHGGEICFAVEAALSTTALLKNQTARARAVEVFSQLRIWDTEHNNGVLIYLLLADRDVEIIVDRGIHAKVAGHEWEAICRAMETTFRQQQFETGVIAGIHTISRHLQKHFPPRQGNEKNELSDKPVIIQ
ncbi:TLP18.3/Psb32/MOLO-1 phosphatase superfamily protein [Nitrosomonas sp. Nm84]|uniref:TPM domain-containing protein n=1 Tax=Nitrosomonas sp. Nm84 TaxID=200124 RepID=UPI000D768C8C|nr:TPM domain-containing protein [Nitrosomonas sp. Nm84]PXW84927.1 TLP18.3/Psb32/MOLO-1 phosphatase superfamily protein [Nitrosomonas sp. Nm84]